MSWSEFWNWSDLLFGQQRRIFKASHDIASLD
jgi:hypothetical protein